MIQFSIKVKSVATVVPSAPVMAGTAELPSRGFNVMVLESTDPLPGTVPSCPGICEPRSRLR